MKLIAIEFLSVKSACASSEVLSPYSNANFNNPFAVQSGDDALTFLKIDMDIVEYTLGVNDQAILNFSVP